MEPWRLIRLFVVCCFRMRGPCAVNSATPCESGCEAIRGTAESRLDKMHAWLGCNVRAQRASAQNKAESGGGRYCTVPVFCKISFRSFVPAHFQRTDFVAKVSLHLRATEKVR
jgi:hypothetical protein